MLSATKPGSEEYPDLIRHLKKLERIELDRNRNKERDQWSDYSEDAPFKIHLINMNRFKPIFDSQSCSLSGSDPNQSLRDEDFDNMSANGIPKINRNLNRRQNEQNENFERLLSSNHSVEVKLTATESLSKSFEPLALNSQSMEVKLNDFP